MEVLKVTVEKEEEKGDELELSLELSIGGRYRKSANLNPREENVKGQINNCDVSRSDRSCGGEGMVGAENGCESVDPRRRREIQALRRQEARKKRDEKLKKSRGVNCVGFVEDNVCLEAQKFQSRVEDREAREIDDLSELARKRDKNVNDEDANGLSLSLFTENKMPSQQACPKVQYVASGHGSEHSSWGPNVGKGDKNEGNNCGSSRAYRNRNSSLDYDSEHSNGTTGHGNRKSVSNGSLQRSSSAVSDYQSTSQKVSLLESSGGSCCDGGSHSSPSHPCQHSHISRTTALDQLEGSGPNQSERSMKLGASTAPQSSWSKLTEKAKPGGTCFVTHACNTLLSTSAASPFSQETAEKPPKPPNHSLSAASVRQMPCVTATGNGPNAKTINGFLYKYTNTEVSIMCVCHGRLFSPAEFVEHAGGVDISHPLRHITVAPSAFRFS